MKNRLLSIIIPAFNEEENIQNTAAVVRGIMEEAKIPYEMLFVSDGSKDKTFSTVLELARADSRIRGLEFSRNFGKEAAIFAGLNAAKGGCAVVMDCDLQHPPQTIVEMYRLWEQGFEIVEGVKNTRGKESVFHKLFAVTEMTVSEPVLQPCAGSMNETIDSQKKVEVMRLVRRNAVRDERHPGMSFLIEPLQHLLRVQHQGIGDLCPCFLLCSLDLIRQTAANEYEGCFVLLPTPVLFCIAMPGPIFGQGRLWLSLLQNHIPVHADWVLVFGQQLDRHKLRLPRVKLFDHLNGNGAEFPGDSQLNVGSALF